MSCSNPNLLIWHGDYNESGRKNFQFVGSLSTHPNQYDGIGLERVLTPCGKCLGCKLDRAKQWADRMLLELDHSKTAVFITLTYDNEHLPVSMIDDTGEVIGTLVKRDLQLFMKRLRKYFSQKECRFFSVGEYGSLRARPHYHIILFGLSLSDLGRLDPVRCNELGQYTYSSSVLSALWSLGFSSVSDVSYAAMNYVARYVQKKRYDKSKIWYAERNVIPEFTLMSRRPGIGMYFLSDHDVQHSTIALSDGFSVKKIALPKKVFERLEILNPDLYNRWKEGRRQAAEFAMIHDLEIHGDFRTSMAVRDVVLSNKTKSLEERELDETIQS